MSVLLLLLKIVLTLTIVAAALWGGGLMAFRLPGAIGILGAAGFLIAAFAGLWGVWTQDLRLVLSFAVVFLGLLGWWHGLKPSHQRDWIPELARLPEITRDGDILTVANLRDFRWRTEQDYDPRWESRRYDLSKLTGADLFLSYWSGETIAHLLLSFTFSDSTPLTISIEIRREKGEEYSALAGFFRSYEMAYVAADERDLIGLRTHARKEDTRLFRLAATPQQARDVLLAYVADINRLAKEPRWYNTLTTNCTTVVYELVSSVAPQWTFSLPLDPRVLLSGYLPGYLRDIGAVRRDMPLASLVQRGRIGEAARKLALDDPDFSAKIREGVPRGQP